MGKKPGQVEQVIPSPFPKIKLFFHMFCVDSSITGHKNQGLLEAPFSVNRIVFSKYKSFLSENIDNFTPFFQYFAFYFFYFYFYVILFLWIGPPVLCGIEIDQSGEK
jgi:hypothetical protein